MLLYCAAVSDKSLNAENAEVRGGARRIAWPDRKLVAVEQFETAELKSNKYLCRVKTATIKKGFDLAVV
ncbi:MAG: hypothetical protein ACI9G1_002040 [Pirellulaceae bacterium]